MDDFFKIYIDQLRDGHTEKIDEKFNPAFIDVKEQDLTFSDPVHVKGDAYLTNDSLVLRLQVATFATIPCAICNAPIKVELKINNLYHVVLFEDVKSGIFNYKEILRENILLEVPTCAECGLGTKTCPHRDEIKQFLKKEDVTKSKSIQEDDGYKPFANLDWKE